MIQQITKAILSIFLIMTCIGCNNNTIQPTLKFLPGDPFANTIVPNQKFLIDSGQDNANAEKEACRRNSNRIQR